MSYPDPNCSDDSAQRSLGDQSHGDPWSSQALTGQISPGDWDTTPFMFSLGAPPLPGLYQPPVEGWAGQVPSPFPANDQTIGLLPDWDPSQDNAMSSGPMFPTANATVAGAPTVSAAFMDENDGYCKILDTLMSIAQSQRPSARNTAASRNIADIIRRMAKWCPDLSSCRSMYLRDMRVPYCNRSMLMTAETEALRWATTTPAEPTWTQHKTRCRLCRLMNSECLVREDRPSERPGSCLRCYTQKARCEMPESENVQLQ